MNVLYINTYHSLVVNAFFTFCTWILYPKSYAEGVQSFVSRFYYIMHNMWNYAFAFFFFLLLAGVWVGIGVATVAS